MSEKTTTIDVQVRDLLDVHPEEDVRASIIVYGPGEPEVVHLSSPHDFVVVGRLDPSNICIEEPSLSRQHARFRWADGRLTVEDLDSRNGTWLGGKRIKTASLHSGDDLQLGGVRAAVAIMRVVSKVKPPSEVSVPGAEDLVVLNPQMRAVYEEIARAASHDAPALILGETGTGKEHVAQALHGMGKRRAGPYKILNCGGIPRGLAESVFFGHEKGSFTGADRRTMGLFEQAHRGVLFLDELGELPNEVQASLLRVVETQKITRLGSDRDVTVDVRIVAATHCNIDAMVEEGTFRKDLAFRLNAMTFELPPLRERRDEIRPMAELFVSRASDSWGRSIPEIDPEVFDKLAAYDWPGNIRQLRNVIERCVLICRANRIEASHLPGFVLEPEYAALSTETPEVAADSSTPDAAASVESSTAPPAPPPDGQRPELSLTDQLRHWETELICRAMRRTGGNRALAARVLRIPRRTLVYKLNSLGLGERNWSAPQAE